MHDIRVLSSGDMCMTLSGHTSTLLRLVVQGRVFEGSWLQSGFGQKSAHFYTIMTEGVIYFKTRTLHIPVRRLPHTWRRG